MRIIFILFLFIASLSADTQKVYLYTTEININNFKSLKVGFDAYLRKHGNYEFQPFNDKKIFEEYLKENDAIVILSSWHYLKIAEKYNLKAVSVAQKKGSIYDTKILVGQIGASLNGVVTSAYDKEYANDILNVITAGKAADLSVLLVPKEIDALMSVGFGMSKFALVSKDSFSALQDINPMLAKNLTIYSESKPQYRMLLTYNKDNDKKNDLISILRDMYSSNEGKNILNMIGIDGWSKLSKDDLADLGGMK